MDNTSGTYGASPTSALTAGTERMSLAELLNGPAASSQKAGDTSTPQEGTDTPAIPVVDNTLPVSYTNATTMAEAPTTEGKTPSAPIDTQAAPATALTELTQAKDDIASTIPQSSPIYDQAISAVQQSIAAQIAAINDPTSKDLARQAAQSRIDAIKQKEEIVRRQVEGLEATANQLQPFKAPPKQSMVEKFGSLGMTFALLSSTFTHQPMVNALNAAASYLNGVREGEKEKYENAYKEWAANTNLALTRNGLQQQSLAKVLDLAVTKPEMYDAALQAHIAQFGDVKAAMLQAAGTEKLAALYAQRESNATQLASHRLLLEKGHIDVQEKFTEQATKVAQAVGITLDTLTERYPGNLQMQQRIDALRKMPPQQAMQELMRYTDTAAILGNAYQQAGDQPRGGQGTVEERRVAELAGKIQADARTRGETISEVDARQRAREQMAQEKVNLARDTAEARASGRTDVVLAKDISKDITALRTARIPLEELKDDILHSYSKSIAGIPGFANRTFEQISAMLGSSKDPQAIEASKRLAAIRILIQKAISGSSQFNPARAKIIESMISINAPYSIFMKSLDNVIELLHREEDIARSRKGTYQEVLDGQTTPSPVTPAPQRQVAPANTDFGKLFPTVK